MSTTASELKTFVREGGFLDSLKKLGFEIAPTGAPHGFWIYRWRDDFIDYIGFWLSSTKNFMNVEITATKACLLNDYDMKNFPKKFENKVPIYSDTFINEDYGVEIGTQSYRVREKQDLPIAFDEILKQIYRSANPWLKAIDTNEKLYDSFSGAFKGTEKAKEVMKTLLDG